MPTLNDIALTFKLSPVCLRAEPHTDDRRDNRFQRFQAWKPSHPSRDADGYRCDRPTLRKADRGLVQGQAAAGGVMGMTEYSGTGPKKVGRGMAQPSLDLIEAMRDIAEAAQPITGRGVGYKLFTRGLIPSMARSEMERVYRLLLTAREQGIIPWEWIVDETREFERVADLGRSRAVRPHRRPLLPPRLLESAAAPRRGLERERHRARRAPAGARSPTPSASASMHGF